MINHRLLLTAGLCASLALAGALAGWAADQEAPVKYVLELSTETMAMPFAMPANMPSIPGMADMFKPKRIIRGEATYPNAAMAPIWVTVPADLKLKSNKLVLEVPQPAGTTEPGGGEGGQAGQGGKMEISTKLYWHPTTAEGPIANDISFDSSKLPQPKGQRGAVMPPAGDLQKYLDDLAKTASGSNDKLPEKVVGAGDYTLNTGSQTIPLAGFLPPIKVTAPASLMTSKPEEGIELKWDPVPGALGFIIHATSMTKEGDKLTIVRWVSTLQEPPVRVQNDYQQETTIADDLANGVLLPPETVTCMIPPGIFPETSSMFTVDVIAVGQDFYDAAGGVTKVGKIRSKWTGMKMGGAGAMPGMPPAEGGEE